MNDLTFIEKKEEGDEEEAAASGNNNNINDITIMKKLFSFIQKES